jgi:hypothetical protein
MPVSTTASVEQPSPSHLCIIFPCESKAQGRAERTVYSEERQLGFRSVFHLPISGDPIKPEKNIEVVQQLGKEDYE